MTLMQLRDAVRYYNCEVVTQAFLDDLLDQARRDNRELNQLRAEVGNLRRALRHEPWWRRRRAG